MREENPPFRQCFEHVFDFTIFAGVCFMKALPSVSTIVISFGYGGVHIERTHIRMSGSRYRMGGGHSIFRVPIDGNGLPLGNRETGPDPQNFRGFRLSWSSQLSVCGGPPKMDKGPFFLASPVGVRRSRLTRNAFLDIFRNYFGRSANLTGPVRYE